MALNRSLAIAAFVALSGSAFAEDVKFTLTNNSSFSIDELYASPSTENAWGEDILGVDILAGGENGIVTIADGSEECKYDLKAVDEDGTEHVLEALDLCETPDVEFSKQILSQCFDITFIFEARNLKAGFH